jgi:hypothetical protein
VLLKKSKLPAQRKDEQGSKGNPTMGPSSAPRPEVIISCLCFNIFIVNNLHVMWIHKIIDQ